MCSEYESTIHNLYYLGDNYFIFAYLWKRCTNFTVLYVCKIWWIIFLLVFFFLKKPAHINPALFTRCLSDSSHLVRFKIGSFEFCSPDPTGKTCNPHPRPVVVLVGWLNAKKQHLEKFADLYRVKGFDVLTMDVSPIHIVRPTVGKKYAMELLEVLQVNTACPNETVNFVNLLFRNS